MLVRFGAANYHGMAVINEGLCWALKDSRLIGRWIRVEACDSVLAPSVIRQNWPLPIRLSSLAFFVLIVQPPRCSTCVYLCSGASTLLIRLPPLSLNYLRSIESNRTYSYRQSSQ